ncbi:MAG TPA: hypothetical protein VGH71_03090, partial [Gammaproteobacteria bacterium]
YLLFLLNARYLGLDMQVEIMAGIVLLGIASWILLRNMAGAGRRDAAPMPALALLTAGVILMSFNQWANFDYGLLSLGGFGGMLAHFLVLLGFARLLGTGLDRRQGALLAAALILAVLGFSGARSPALVGSCLLAALAAWWVMPEARGRILRQAGLFLAGGAIVIGIYLTLLHQPQSLNQNLGDGVRAVLLHPLEALAYLSGVVGQSMFDRTLAKGVTRAIGLSNWLPACGYLLLGWCLWRYFRARYWRTSWMPLLLIAYSALFTLEVLVGRYGADGQLGSKVPRYVFDAHLWLVGCAWILGLDWRERLPQDRPWWRRAMPIALLTAMLGLELVNGWLAYRRWPFEVADGAAVGLRLRAVITGEGTVDGLPDWECPSKELCTQGLAILQKHHLSIARDAADPEVLSALRKSASWLQKTPQPPP